MDHRHFILYKPDGYLSQFVNQQTKRKNKKLLGQLHDFPEGTMAIGRLDEPSEGLLFLTTDGKTSEHIRSNKVEKEYFTQVDGIIDNQSIIELSNGVTISTDEGQYRTKPCNVRKLNDQPKFHPRSKKIRDDRHGPTSWISITVFENIKAFGVFIVFVSLLYNSMIASTFSIGVSFVVASIRPNLA